MYCTCNSDEKRVSLRFDVNHQSCNQDLSSLTNLNPNEVLPYMVFKDTCMRSPEGYGFQLI